MPAKNQEMTFKGPLQLKPFYASVQIPGFWSMLGGVSHQNLEFNVTESPCNPAAHIHQHPKNSSPSKGDIVSSHLRTVLPAPALQSV